MFVKPAEGVRVRIPRLNTLVPAEGLEVDPANGFWDRMLREGSVVEATPLAEPAEPAPPAGVASSTPTVPSPTAKASAAAPAAEPKADA